MGYHPTISYAIHKAFTTSGKIFEFNTFFEVAGFVVSKKI